MLNVGEYIKILRTQKNMTQEELGKLIGVKRAAVQKWECGRVQNLKRTTIQKLSSIFEVDPSSFVAEHTAQITTAFNEEMADIYFQMRKNEKLAEVIKILCKLPPERLDAVLLFLKALE